MSVHPCRAGTVASRDKSPVAMERAWGFFLSREAQKTTEVSVSLSHSGVNIPTAIDAISLKRLDEI